MNENSVYVITPPEMQLLESGPSVTVLSTNNKFFDSVEAVHENLFKTVPINLYKPNSNIKDDNVAWTLSVMRLSDNVFVDLDTASETSIIAAMLSEANLVLISEKNKKSTLVKLLNSVHEYTIYKSPEDYMDMVVSQFV